MLPERSDRGGHGFRTTDKPCPQCGETGHEVAMVLGVRAILCPETPFGEMRPYSDNRWDVTTGTKDD